MKNKCTVIQISGIRGILIVGFIITCTVAGFIIFPSYCCQQIWNCIAGFVNGMPVMELKHGVILWFIVALVSYMMLFGKFKISFVSAKETDNIENNMDNIELLKSIKKEIVEEIEKEEIKK